MDSFLFPITNAQGVLNIPLGNSFGLVPGITTEFSSTIPFTSTGSFPVTSIIGVEEVSVTFAPITAPFFILTPYTIIDREPINAPSSTTTGIAPAGSRTPPIPTPPERWTFFPI